MDKKKPETINLLCLLGLIRPILILNLLVYNDLVERDLLISPFHIFSAYTALHYFASNRNLHRRTIAIIVLHVVHAIVYSISGGIESPSFILHIRNRLKSLTLLLDLINFIYTLRQVI